PRCNAPVRTVDTKASDAGRAPDVSGVPHPSDN
ncbi:hypothetical protein F441_15842, partial [Phytophthora nicotianae CJ01A1]